LNSIDTYLIFLLPHLTYQVSAFLIVTSKLNNTFKKCLIISIESFYFFRVQKLIRDNKVMIFSATYCSYCNVAKRTFDSIGTEYEAIELNKVEDGPELATDLKAITGTNYVSCSIFYSYFSSNSKVNLNRLLGWRFYGFTDSFHYKL
jgi:hypothetical protein